MKDKVMGSSESVENGDELRYIPVAEFYRDRHIFITGGTGFMGKVLLEKLLRSCPEIGNIYMLIRPKKGQIVTDRLRQVLSSPLMEHLKQTRPQMLERVIAIEGDITEPELGISNIDQQTLFENVSIVFHSAATVKFDEQLKLSVYINMLGTKRLVQLCHKMQKLEALVHVSTAYCNCDRIVIGEEIYPQSLEPEHVTQIVDWLPEPVLDRLTVELVGKKPNTYTFTKALAETMLQQLAGNLPVTIVRPSIVLSSFEGPLPGWLDNWNGPTGMIAAAGKGMLRTMLCHGDKKADMVPVDIVCNVMICAAWRTALNANVGSKESQPNPIIVYNVCSGGRRPLTWKDFVDISFIYSRKHPFGNLLWYPDGTLTSNSCLHNFLLFWLQWCPAYVFDMFYTIIGKKPFLCKVQDKLMKATKCLHYFTTQEWEFKDDNVIHLNNLLSDNDKKEFLIDITKVEWHKYIENYIIGIRRFIFKEKLEDIPKCKAELNRLAIYNRMLQVLSVIFVWRFILLRSSYVQQLWTSAFYLMLRLIRLLPIF